MADQNAGTVKAQVEVTYDGSGIEEAKKDLQSLAEAAGNVGGNVEDANKSLSDLNSQMAENTAQTKEFGNAVADAEKPFSAGEEAVTGYTEALQEHNDAINDVTSAYEENKPAVEESTALLDEHATQMQKTSELAQVLGSQVENLNDGFDRNTAKLSDNVDGWYQVSSAFSDGAESFQRQAQNLQIFQDAINSPDTFGIINEHIRTTGQNYNDFMDTIGQSNADTLNTLAQISPSDETTYTVLPSQSELDKLDSWNAASKQTQAFLEASKSVETFNGQVTALNENTVPNATDNFANMATQVGSADEAVKEFLGPDWVKQSTIDAATSGPITDEQANQAVKEFLGLDQTSAPGGETTGGNGGGFFSSLFSNEGQAEWLFGSGGIMGMLNDVAMPLMALNMIGAGVSSLGQNMYDAAAIAEGPAAHSIGTFTGAVDQLNKSAAQTGQTFSEQFGQGVLPALNGFNSNNASTSASGGFDWTGWIGKGLGMEAGLGLDILDVVGGGIAAGLIKTVTLDPNNAMANGLWQGGWEGLQNYWADWTGQQEPYPTTAMGPAPIPFFDQQAIDSYYGVGNTAQEQAAYGVSHYGGTTGPSDPMNAVIQYELDRANGGATGMTNPDPNAAYSNSFTPFDNGCFVAGTPILMADGTERAIETLRIGDSVLAHDGEKQVVTTVLARIFPHPKRVYKLTFSDGATLVLTNSHPISTTQGWKSLSPDATKLENPDIQVGKLEIGDSINTFSGVCTLGSILPLPGKRQIYNITVDAPHTFYAAHVLVHNKTYGSGGNASSENEQVQLNHTFSANITWQANDLNKSFTAAAQWAEQNLVHQAVAAAQWGESNLVHMATASAEWAEEGLLHMATAAAEWTEQNLIHPAIAAAQWAEQGLVHEATAVANWADQGLTHIFTGVANWAAEGLEHTFNAVANWTAQNLTPNFTVNPSVTMLADGASNFAGGPAIVAEAGYPEVVEHNGNYSLFNQPSLLNLPSGTNVIPMKNTSIMGGSPVSQFADGTSPTIPLMLSMPSGAGGAPSSVNVIVQLDSMTLLQVLGIPFAQTIRVQNGNRTF